MIRDPKPELRRLARAARAAACAVGGEAAAHAVAARVLAAGVVSAGTAVGGYWPSGSELDPRPLLEALDRLACRCALPVVTDPDRPLCFRSWRPGDILVPGPVGALEPTAEAPELVPMLLLVPLLGFDTAGHRLGQGGGYYDRTLAALRRSGEVTAVGLAFAAQQLPPLPAAAHDQRLDLVVTETDLWTFGE